jgi:hypothetical protein
MMMNVLCAVAPAWASTEAAWRIRPVRVVPQGADATLGGQVRIEGVMSFSGSLVESWLPPRCGAIDFFCRTGSGDTPFWCTGQKGECEALCQMAWRDIELAASRGECVAFPLRLWAPAEQVIKSVESPFSGPNPFDPVMGVSVVPCHPEAPSDLRPDLSMSCLAGASVDAGAIGTGGATGAGGSTPAAGGAGGLRDPAAMPTPACAISRPGDSGGSAWWMGLLAGLVAIGRARLRRTVEQRPHESTRRDR